MEPGARLLSQRGLGKSGRPDWRISCLTAAMLPRIRSEHDEANTTDAQPGFQGESGAGGVQVRMASAARNISSTYCWDRLSPPANDKRKSLSRLHSGAPVQAS